MSLFGLVMSWGMLVGYDLPKVRMAFGCFLVPAPLRNAFPKSLVWFHEFSICWRWMLYACTEPCRNYWQDWRLFFTSLLTTMFLQQCQPLKWNHLVWDSCQDEEWRVQGKRSSSFDSFGVDIWFISASLPTHALYPRRSFGILSDRFLMEGFDPYFVLVQLISRGGCQSWRIAECIDWCCCF